MAWETLFLTEGFAVGASGHTGILLMGAHKDVVQRAVVLASAVISALCDGALDALVGMTVHDIFLLFLISPLGFPGPEQIYSPAEIAFFGEMWYFMHTNMTYCQKEDFLWR